MGNTKRDDNGFMTFMRGYWELPMTRPNLFHAFLRGAILAALLSVIFPARSTVELVSWVIIVGAAWAAVDYLVWRFIVKKKGE